MASTLVQGIIDLASTLGNEFKAVRAEFAAQAGDRNPVTTLSPGSTSTALTTTSSRTVRVSLTAATTFTIAAGTTGYSYTQTLILVQDTTGSRTVTWPTSVKWDKGTKPTLSTTAGAIDVVTLLWTGTEWIGFFGAGAVA